MAMEQVRAQVKAPASEREWDPERGKVLVLETELVQVQVLVLDWVRAAAMERNPVWGQVLVPILALELVQARETDWVRVQVPETDRVTDQ